MKVFLSFRKLGVWKESSKSATDETRKEEKREVRKRKDNSSTVPNKKGDGKLCCLSYYVVKIVLAFSFKYICFFTIYIVFHYIFSLTKVEKRG